MKEIIFVTGNADKAAYLSKMVDYPFEYFDYNHPEIQASTLEEIVEEKTRSAFEQVGKAVLVEDVSLGLDEHGGMPGPFIKFYVEPDKARDEPNTPEMRAIKLERICRIADSTLTRSAKAACVMGYFDGERLVLMRGELKGKIADHPVGVNGFGWDAIFCPDGFGGKTRAELVPSDDAATYASIKPFEALRELLHILNTSEIQDL